MKAAILALLLSGVAAAGAAAPAQPVRAELKTDRVSIFVGDRLFTEYLFAPDEKYPYFFPVNGPRSGESVTSRRNTNFPHHSSIFFGCDRVNGGDYWQEDVGRGRIVSKDVRLIRAAGEAAVFEQECRWERPGADAPFRDHRRIAISAPSPDERCIDFDITLTALTAVRIEKTNHSLFSIRMAPELSVAGGGTLINANGDSAEKGTFGKIAAWADFRGTRQGVTEGAAIFVHPRNRWSPPPWFTRDYGFFSPTPMYWLEKGSVAFSPGEQFRLRYRVLIHAGDPDAAGLESRFRRWAAAPLPPT